MTKSKRFTAENWAWEVREVVARLVTESKLVSGLAAQAACLSPLAAGLGMLA